MENGPEMGTETMTDAELVVSAQEGRERAFEELVRRHEAKVLTLARRLVVNVEDARDLAQDVFVRAFRAIDRVDPARRFEGWLMTITVNTCRSFLSRRKTLAPLGDAEPADARPANESSGVAADALQEALAGLPAKYRIPLVLFHQEERSCDEIAAILSASSGRIRTRLHRGRRMLREAMTRKGFSPRGAS